MQRELLNRALFNYRLKLNYVVSVGGGGGSQRRGCKIVKCLLGWSEGPPEGPNLRLTSLQPPARFLNYYLIPNCARRNTSNGIN